MTTAVFLDYNRKIIIQLGWGGGGGGEPLMGVEEKFGRRRESTGWNEQIFS